MAFSDDGTELTSHGIVAWNQDTVVERQDISSGKSRQNGFAETLDGRFRDEYLTEPLFPSPAAAVQIIRGMVDRLRHRASAQQPRRHGTRRIHQPAPPRHEEIEPAYQRLESGERVSGGALRF